MNPGPATDDPRSVLHRVLERITAIVLVLVVVMVGWIIALAWQPDWGGWASTEAQVIVSLALLAAALILVSILALWQTSD